MAAPRFATSWTPIEPIDGRASLWSCSIEVPRGWIPYRIPPGPEGEAMALLPKRRRFRLPFPIIGVVRLTENTDASRMTAAELADLVRRPLPGDVPVDVTSVSTGTAFVAGENALAIDVEARLRDRAIGVPRLILAVAKAMAGIRPATGRAYVIDRAGVRWGIGWLGWTKDADALRATGEGVVGSVRWSP